MTRVSEPNSVDWEVGRAVKRTKMIESARIDALLKVDDEKWEDRIEVEDEGCCLRTGMQLDLRLGDFGFFCPDLSSGARPVSCVESTVGGVKAWKWSKRGTRWADLGRIG